MIGNVIALATGWMLLLAVAAAEAQSLPPATLPTTQPIRLPHLDLDVSHRRVRMECEAVNAASPLEFLVCAAGGAEHETVLRSRAKGSHLHLAMLIVGLVPGQPLRVSQPGDRPIAPTGPRLRITCEYERDGRMVSVPPHRLMRNLKTKQPLEPMTFVFAGSRVMKDGRYAADVTGHLISVVNFEYSVIDLAELRSNSNDSLEWEINPDTAPPRGTKVWLTIEAVDERVLNGGDNNVAGHP